MDYPRVPAQLVSRHQAHQFIRSEYRWRSRASMLTCELLKSSRAIIVGDRRRGLLRAVFVAVRHRFDVEHDSFIIFVFGILDRRDRH